MRPKTKKKQKRTIKKTLTPEIKRLMPVIQKACRQFKAPENITVSEWADKYRLMQSENSAEVGKWRTARTPYMKEIMDAFTDPAVREVAVVAGSQMGKTEALLNIIGYIIDQDPGTIMFCHPTIEEGEKFSKQRIAPMIRDIPKLRNKVDDTKSRVSGNTIRQKKFPGGVLNIMGSNSPASLASVPARYVLGDEVDRWAKSAGTEGNPWDLLKARTSNFYNAKLVRVSTPTIKGFSEIEKAFNKGTQEYWSVQCPKCKEYSFLTLKQVKIDYHKIYEGHTKQYIVDKTEWECPVCNNRLDEYHTKRQPMKWVAKMPEAIKNGVRSFWINGFYSPWASWDSIAAMFLNSKDDPASLQTVFNTKLGELWEYRGDLEDEDKVMQRAEEYEAELPDGVLCLTCGVDVQDNRIEYEVVGYGFNKENWGIKKGVINGRADDYATWEELDKVIERPYRFKNGKTLKISVTFVDEGGHFTQNVRENCAMRRGKNVYVIKGANNHDAPFISPWKVGEYNAGQGRKGKYIYYMIGVDAGKSFIMSGLKIKGPGTRMSHFPSDKSRGYDAEYYNQLLSEALLPNEKGELRWTKIPGHNRNEALDCRNYANAALEVLRPNFEYLEARLNHPEDVKKVSRPRKTKSRRMEDDIW